MDSVILLEASVFPEKLWYLVSNHEYDQAIHWNETGISIIIQSLQVFTDIVLGSDKEIFKTKNITSIIRQLNLYGFRKISRRGRDPNFSRLAVGLEAEFRHPCFVRDHFELLKYVKRMNPCEGQLFKNVNRPLALHTDVPIHTADLTTVRSYRHNIHLDTYSGHSSLVERSKFVPHYCKVPSVVDPCAPTYSFLPERRPIPSLLYACPLECCTRSTNTAPSRSPAHSNSDNASCSCHVKQRSQHHRYVPYISLRAQSMYKCSLFDVAADYQSNARDAQIAARASHGYHKLQKPSIYRP